MPETIKMPRYGANMEEGTLIEWLVAVGESVEKGTPLAEIESEKLSNTLEAPMNGVILKLYAEEGETLSCGQPILVIGEAGENWSDISENEKQKNEGPQHQESEVRITDNDVAAFSYRDESVSSDDTPELPPKITPKALVHAQQLGVRFEGINGTGIHGMITRTDIQRVYEQRGKKGEAAAGRRRMTTMEKELSKRMLHVSQTTAPSTLMRIAHVDKIVEDYAARKSFLTKHGIRLSYTAYFVKAAALALQDAAQVRTMIVETGELEVCGELSVGVAVEVPGGLLVPVIRDAAQKSLSSIAQELDEVGAKARNGQLSAKDLHAGAITITNLGVYGIRQFTPVLNAPQSAILGIGVIERRIIPEEHCLRIGNIVHLSMTVDHRIVNGGPAARYLKSLAELLEHPDPLFDCKEAKDSRK